MLRLFQRSPETYVPYAGHFPNTPHTAFLLDGTVCAILEMDPAEYQLAGPAARNARTALCNDVLRQAADNNVTVYSHLIRHGAVSASPVNQAGFTSAFARDLYSAYASKVLPGLRTNTWLLTVLVRPAAPQARKLLRVRREPRPSFRVSPAQMRKLEEVTNLLRATFTEHKPRRLGVRSVPTDIPGVSLHFSEIGEALFLVRTGVRADIPLCNGSLGGAVYSQRVVTGPRFLDLNLPGRPRYGAILAYRNYPHSARPGCLNELLSAPYDLVLSQSFAFLLSGKSEAKSALKAQQMENLGDAAVSQRKGLADATDDLVSGRTASGMHHLSLAVYADAASRRRPDVDAALNDLDLHLGDATKRLSSFGGCNPIQEGRFGLECAYFAQMPGVWTWRTRPGELDTRSFAAMSSFEGFPPGHARGRWGPAVARFRTAGGTAYDYIPHVEEIGHTMFTGRTGIGKTALAMFLMTCMEPALGRDGIRLVIDKDAGSKPLVELSGGRYLPLRRGRPSGLAPLRGLADSPMTRSFLFNGFRGLILRDGLGPLDPEEERRMARGIACQMEMPRALRTLAGVREFMGYSKNGAGDRFEKWCRGGEMGWVWDNDEHLVDFNASVQSRLYGFDFTELMPKDEQTDDDGACAAAAAVIVHQLREMMDGRRIVAFFDECRFYLDSLGSVIEDFALTGRKNELMVWMAAQEPSHFLNHPVGRSLVGQCQTKIAFPDIKADVDAYVHGLKFTRAAAEQVKSGMTVGGNRRFLLWRDEGAAVCEFDLSAMPDELAILSGRKSTVGLLDRIAGGPRDATERYREFRRRSRTILEAAE